MLKCLLCCTVPQASGRPVVFRGDAIAQMRLARGTVGRDGWPGPAGLAMRCLHQLVGVGTPRSSGGPSRREAAAAVWGSRRARPNRSARDADATGRPWSSLFRRFVAMRSGCSRLLERLNEIVIRFLVDPLPDRRANLALACLWPREQRAWERRQGARRCDRLMRARFPTSSRGFAILVRGFLGLARP